MRLLYTIVFSMIFTLMGYMATLLPEVVHARGKEASLFCFVLYAIFWVLALSLSYMIPHYTEKIK